MADSKFIVGAKVYKRYGYFGDWVEDYVDRAHQNGNFVLLGEPGQWRPYNNASACKAGKRDRWSRHYLRLADEEMEAEVKAGRAEKARHNRRCDLIKTLENTPSEQFTDEILNDLEATVKKLHSDLESAAVVEKEKSSDA